MPSTAMRFVLSRSFLTPSSVSMRCCFQSMFRFLAMKMLVLGAGLQGSACAYDLLQDNSVSEVRLARLHVSHLPPFLAPYSGPRLIPTVLDVRNHDAVLALMKGCTAVMSALPYYFNLEMARLAVDAGAHFCDLGGNTEI